MENIFEEIWKRAKPYYEKGRSMDIDHIEWMIKEAEVVCQKEKIDKSLLMPLVILHDVGYAKVPKDNPFNLDIRKAHMEAGAIIAEKILKELNYPLEKIERIKYYVSVHDNWAFGEEDIYLNDKVLGVLKDLDYIWIVSAKRFYAIAKILEKTNAEMIKWVNTNEKQKKRPFSTIMTKNLFYKCLREREEEVGA